MAYRSSHTKRHRRSKTDIEALCADLYDILDAYHPMTVRQVFYQMVSTGKIDKTENEYDNVVVRLLGLMRRQGQLPYAWIADNTRWMRKQASYNSIDEALKRTAQLYRRDLWANQKDYVEIWLEKDALAGVLYEVTNQWDVPLMVTRGYSSLSFLYEAAEYITGNYPDRDVYLYYFGDYDPSGVDIPRVIEDRLAELAPDMSITFQCAAVVPIQIGFWNLLTRPTKHTDSRSKTFRGESVEVDAIPPATLHALVTNCIERHIDPRALQITKQAEKEERKILTLLRSPTEKELPHERL